MDTEYLPDMSAVYEHPKVKTHIGDGFKFLAGAIRLSMG